MGLTPNAKMSSTPTKEVFPGDNFTWRSPPTKFTKRKSLLYNLTNLRVLAGHNRNLNSTKFVGEFAFTLLVCVVIFSDQSKIF